MGFKCSLLALSNRAPREDITTTAEGGPDAATKEAERLWPGEWRYVETGTLDEAFLPYDESLWIGTWGGTTVLTHMAPVEVSDPTRGSWELMIHSVVDLCHYKTPASHRSRTVSLSADDDAEALASALQGELLPFEEPYAAGQHSSDGDPFHTLDLGESALLWMFGTFGETAPVDDVSKLITPIKPWELPMHRFEAAPASPTPSAPEASDAPPAPPKKRSWLDRLLGR